MDDDKVTIVFRGYLRLDLDEQNELIRKINEYNTSSEKTSSKSLNEAKFNRIYLGPVNSGCTCCGK